MVIKLRLLALFLFLLGVWLILTAPASAHHNGPLLPLVPNTPLMQSIIRTEAYTWCVNATAAAYPNFVAQVRDVQDQYTARTSIKHRQVDWGVPFGIVAKDAGENLIPQTGCQMQHNFVPGLQCGGCAAHVFYANNPVVVEYAADRAYVDWRTTIGHENGHALLGLHEQYDDVAFRCLTDRTWTVMSCGTGVRYPQGFDVLNGCQVLNTPWCGVQPLPPPCESPCWTGERWVFADGFSYDPVADTWYDPLDRLAFGPRASWGGRYSPLTDAWHPEGTSFFKPDVGIWYTTP